MKNKIFIFSNGAPVWGQNDEVVSAQHLILGQQASGVAQLRSLTNTHPDAQWFPRAGFGLFIHLGMSAMHGGIDLSWGMLKNKSWEDGEISPVEYWKLADRWNPVNFKPEEWAKQVKRDFAMWFSLPNITTDIPCGQVNTAISVWNRKWEDAIW